MCCTQYVSKFGQLSSGHRTGKCHFSFQSQRRTTPKNVPATVQLCSFHTPVRLCTKSFKLDFSSIRTKNFQMYKLGLDKAREFQKNIYFCFTDYAKSLTVWITTNCGKFFRRWEYWTALPVSCITGRFFTTRHQGSPCRLLHIPILPSVHT